MADMSFGQAFLHLLERSGMSQADFARKSGFSTAYVSMLLSGEIKDPKFTRACEIADALGVTLQDFHDLMRG